MGRLKACAIALASVQAICSGCAYSAMRADTAFEVSLPAQDLRAALTELGRLSGQEVIIADAAVAGRRAPALRGRFTAAEAFERLLRGSDAVAEFGEGAVLIKAAVARRPLADDAGEKEIVVTGSSIRGVAPAGSPATTIDRADIDRSGYATTQQILQAIPQAYLGGPNETTFGVSSVNGAENGQWAGASINLRGLGAGSTLTLLNGHRVPLGGYGGFADISLIPAAAIERIEVLSDGASAIYGSDAVAGVVNIRLRDGFTGAETRARYGTSDGDADERQASQLLGARWQGGHALLAYEFYQRDSLAASKRDFVTEDLRPFGGGDYRTGYGVPGTIIAGGRSFAIPAGQDGTRLTPSQLVAGQRNRSDARATSDLLPRQQRHSLYASASQEVASGFDLYAELLFSHRSFRTRPRLDIRSAVQVPVTNPFYVDPIGTRQPVSVQYDFTKDIGPPLSTGHSETLTGTLGVRQAVGPWRLEAYAVHGRQSDANFISGYLNRPRTAQALADTNPATALNVFGDGSYRNPPEVTARIRGSFDFTSGYRFWSGIGKVDGPLLALPGGDVRLAAGAEYRRETTHARFISDTSTLVPTERPYLDFPGARMVTAAFGEVFVPIVGETNESGLLRRLAVSLAGRIEHYNDFGTATTPKLGVDWEPAEGVRLRASYGRSFRAPNFVNLIQAGLRFSTIVALPDPRSATGTSNVLILFGNDPDLGPERARTWTVGADLQPNFLPGLSAKLTYFDIAYRDRIVDPSGSSAGFLTDRATYAPLLDEAPSAATIAQLYAQPEFSNPDNIAPAAVRIIADAHVQNLASVRQNGVDGDLGYSFSTGGGQAEVGVDATYIFRIRQAITASAAATDIVGTIGNPTELRVRGRTSWSSGGFSLAAFGNYTDRYRNTLIAGRPRVRSFTTVDLQIAYRNAAETGPLVGVDVALSATNVFDRRPPFVEYFTGTSAVGYDPENASALGRTISLQVTKRW